MTAAELRQKVIATGMWLTASDLDAIVGLIAAERDAAFEAAANVCESNADLTSGTAAVACDRCADDIRHLKGAR